MVNRRTIALLITLTQYLSVSLVMLHAQTLANTDEHKKILFESSSPLEIKLKANFSELLKSKNEIGYIKAECTVYWTTSDSSIMPIRIKPRGNFRRKNCSFPPLMLNFKQDSLQTADGNYGKLKLVTHCQNSKKYKSYILREYLLYKIYQKLTPFSFKTRLVHIDYIDDNNKKNNFNKIGFLIEPIESICDRTETIVVNKELISDSEINTLHADRVAIFNYMVGNTDYRIQKTHNIAFVRQFPPNSPRLISIPYDFDHAGFVNTNYAKPAEWSTAKHVKERDYIGRCRNNNNTYNKLIPEFLSIKQEVYRTIDSFPELEQKDKTELIKYIKSFYDELEDETTFLKLLHKNCLDRY